MQASPRFDLTMLLAYNELLRLKIGACPIYSDTFLTPSEHNVIVCSYQEFCEHTRVPIDIISLGGRLEDGFCVSGVGSSRTMIFYNADKYTQRLRFTIMHEVGHIILSHKRNAKREEAEANSFASQFLMPSVIIFEINRRGYSLDAKKLCKIFDISMSAADVKMSQLKSLRHKRTHLDDDIVRRFTPYLNQYFPYKLSPFSHEDHFYGSRENYRAYQNLEDNMLFP